VVPPLEAKCGNNGASRPNGWPVRRARLGRESPVDQAVADPSWAAQGFSQPISGDEPPVPERSPRSEKCGLGEMAQNLVRPQVPPRAAVAN